MIDDYEYSEEELLAQYSQKNLLLDETVLQGIEQINWSELSHAYGIAIDTPAWLRATFSGNPYHRGIAFESLHSSICHQGTIYQATSYVVPFLIRMLSFEHTPDLDEVILLLDAISWSYTDLLQYFENEGIDFNKRALEEEYVFYAREAHTAVRAGLKQYLPLIYHPLAKVRQANARLLCSFPEDADQILPALYDQVRQEIDEEVQGWTINSEIVNYLLEVTELFSPSRAKFVSLFEDIVHRLSDHIMARFPAACAVAKLAPENISSLSGNTLVYAIAHPEEIDPYSRFTPPDPDFFPPEMHQEVCENLTIDKAIEALSLLDPLQSIKSLMQGLAKAKRSEHTHSIAIMLLSISLLDKRHKLNKAILNEPPEIREGTIYYVRTQEKQPPDRMERRLYPILIPDISAISLNPVQEEVIESVRTNEKIRGIESNLILAFGIKD